LDNLGLAPEAGQGVADAAVVLLDGGRQVLAHEQLVWQDHPVAALPIVRDKGFAAYADFVEQPAQGRIIMST